jgi:A/G-specific adenine glycosylase
MTLMAYETRESKKLSNIAPALLAWYEENARILPWRLGPGARREGKTPDPYHVWLSEIMLQQTTVKTVAPRFKDFVGRWENVEALARASLDDVLGEWAGLGYYARARNLHQCARAIVEKHGGAFPRKEEALRKLPGIGDYTAAAVAAIAFDAPAAVVDGNIERVLARLFLIDAPLPRAKAEIKKRAREIWPLRRSGDFAQGLMDLGALVCKPKEPSCGACPLPAHCRAYARGNTQDLPNKPPKKQRPRRCGAVFALLKENGDMLFARRPEAGLLAGCLGLPGTPWADGLPEDIFAWAPARAVWKKAGEATHIFTHFHLTLDVYAARAPKGFRRKKGQEWMAPENAPLPTVMKKAAGLLREKRQNARAGDSARAERTS